MSNSAWPEGAIEDTIGLVQIGVEAKKVMQFLQAKFPSHQFEYNCVKSFIYRYRRRGNALPRAHKWTEDVSARAIALVRAGTTLVDATKELNKDFPQIKFRKSELANHMYHVRRSTGDKTLFFPGRRPVDIEIKDKIKDLVKNTDMNSREIAAELGITKGAVCGLLWRIREKSGDETMRVRGRAPEWKPVNKGIRNSGAVVKAVKSAVDRQTKVPDKYVERRELKVQRRIAMLNMSDHPNAVHILDRVEYTHYAGAAMGVAIIQHAQCPWPLWGDGTSFPERFMCGNPKEEHGHYCKAHMCLAHDVRLPGTFKGSPNRWTVSHSWKRQGMGRAA